MRVNWKHQALYAWAFALGLAACALLGGCGEIREMLEEAGIDMPSPEMHRGPMHR